MAKTFRRNDEPENENYFNKLYVDAKRQHVSNKLSDEGRNRFEHRLNVLKRSLVSNLKPYKNRRVCPECNRSKQLFGSEEEALNFIRFNGDKFKHQNELRVYWCKSCGSFHYTSKPYRSGLANPTDRLIAASNLKPNGVYARIKAEKLWREMDWDVRSLSKPAFDRYCELKLHVKLTSSVYMNGLAKLYESFHSAA